jgi:hypothetical protein
MASEKNDLVSSCWLAEPTPYKFLYVGTHIQPVMRKLDSNHGCIFLLYHSVVSVS